MENSKIESVLKEELKKKELLLEEKETELEPIRQEVKRLRMMLRDYTAGSLGSSQIADNQIVSWLKKNSSDDAPRFTPDIAAAFGGDGRGFSRRLPRMAKQGMIAGSADTGYYIPSVRKPVPANA